MPRSPTQSQPLHWQKFCMYFHSLTDTDKEINTHTHTHSKRSRCPFAYNVQLHFESDWDEGSASTSSHFTQSKVTSSHSTAGWVAPSTSQYSLQELIPLPGIKPHFFDVEPTARSLYQVNYPSCHKQ